MEVLEKYAPGVSKNPMIGMAKGMTLKAVIAINGEALNISDVNAAARCIFAILG